MSTINEYAHKIIDKYIQKALSYEENVRLGDDQKSVHHMRVTLRKVITALNVFKPYISPKLKKYKKFLKQIIASLGKIRDIDVQLNSINLKRNPHGHKIIRHLRAQRKLAHSATVKLFDQIRYRRKLAKLIDILKTEIHTSSDQITTYTIYKDIIKQQMRKYTMLGDRVTIKSNYRNFHHLRLRGKTLRYTLEFFDPIAKRLLKPLTTKISLLQNMLGVINDHHNIKKRLTDLIAKNPIKLKPNSLSVLQQTATHCAVLEKDKREKFIEYYHSIDWDMQLLGKDDRK